VLNASRGRTKPTKRKGRRENVAISADDKVARPRRANDEIYCRCLILISLSPAADHLAAPATSDEPSRGLHRRVLAR